MAQRGHYKYLGMIGACALMTAGCLWLVLEVPGWFSKAVGVIGVVLFGSGVVAGFLDFTSGVAYPSHRQPKGLAVQRHDRTTIWVLPLAMLFTLPWPWQLSFCVPLLLAAALLLPGQRDPRIVRLGRRTATAIAIAHAVFFAIVLVSFAVFATSRGELAFPALMFGMALWLDLSLLREARRVREAWQPRPAS